MQRIALLTISALLALTALSLIGSKKQANISSALNAAIPTGECRPALNSDCGVVSGVCIDIATAFSDICKASGGSNCTDVFIDEYLKCMKDGGCGAASRSIPIEHQSR